MFLINKYLQIFPTLLKIFKYKDKSLCVHFFILQYKKQQLWETSLADERIIYATT